MFVSNNRVSFHSWWKENLVKYQKASKNYENNSQQDFLLLFKSLSTTPIVETVIFRLEFTLSL